MTANNAVVTAIREIEFLWSAFFGLFFVCELLAIALLIIVSTSWILVSLVAVLWLGTGLWGIVSHLRVALKM
jgi:hypothetical protein